MRFGSVCSGIEAASVAWKPLGWEPVFFSEIEAFPSAVLAHHHPEVPNLGDMTKFQEWPDVAIDLLVGGTPCQSFSVAGLRAGMADPRGNLALTYLAIAAKYRPRWLLWENVPGVLSSNGGRDFGSILGGMVELGYGVAYRVLDAQFCRASGLPFAVPQRRRRVFVVGYLGDWRRAAAVLFDAASLRGDSPPRREAGKGVAPTISSRPTGGGGLGTDFDLDGGVIAFGSKEYAQDAGPVSPPLRAMNNDGSHPNGGGQIAIAFHGTQDPDISGDVTHPIGRNQGQEAVIAFDTTQITHPENRSNPQPGDPDGSLAKGGHPPAIVFQPRFVRNDRGAPDTEVAGPLTAQAGETGKGDSAQVVAIQAGAVRENPASGPDGVGVNGDGASYTIEARAEVQAVAAGWAVRRLTPRECERLQGFPDDYTLIQYRGKPAADGPRYKALGNSMATNVMSVIGERIQMVEDMIG